MVKGLPAMKIYKIRLWEAEEWERNGKYKESLKERLKLRMTGKRGDEKWILTVKVKDHHIKSSTIIEHRMCHKSLFSKPEIRLMGKWAGQIVIGKWWHIRTRECWQEKLWLMAEWGNRSSLW